MSKLKAIIKYFLSFLKKNWSISDYPLRIREQKGVPEHSRWCAQIIFWYQLAGLGKTREEALDNLNEYFNEYIKKNNAPRPGTKVPIEIASTDIIDQYPELIDDFIEKILGFGPEDPVLITDLSSLHDFSTDENEINDLKLKIINIYSINIESEDDYYVSNIIKK